MPWPEEGARRRGNRGRLGGCFVAFVDAGDEILRPRAIHVGPSSVVSVGGGFVAVGYTDKMPTVWRSGDGRTWTSRTLPGPVPTFVDLQFPVSVMAGPRGQLVAIGSLAVRDNATVPMAWLATDSGATWRAAEMPDVGGSAQIRGVVHTGHEHLTVGTTGFDPHAAGLVLIRAMAACGSETTRPPCPVLAGIRR